MFDTDRNLEAARERHESPPVDDGATTLADEREDAEWERRQVELLSRTEEVKANVRRMMAVYAAKGE